MSFKKVILVSLVAVCVTGCWITVEGQKTGVIVKFAQEGMFFKTYEAELIRGGFNSGSGINGQSFHFSIENPILAEKLKNAFENQKEVIIKYHNEAFTGCGRGETKTFLDDVIINGE